MTVSKRSRKSALGLTFLLATILMPSLDGIQAAAVADPVTAKNLKQKITTAKTTANHKAIAGYYQSEAAKAKAKVTEHQEMLEVYKKVGVGTVAKSPNQPGTIEH